MSKTNKKDQNPIQLVIPQSYQKKDLQECHNYISHMGIEQMFDLLWDLFYWPGMMKDVELHITRCDWFVHFKRRPWKVVIENIQATHPLQLVYLDYLTIEITECGKDVHVLIITNHFTWYVQALVTSLQSAKCTAQDLGIDS